MDGATWQQLVEGAPIGFFTLDDGLRITAWSGACSAQFLYREEEVLGREFAGLLEQPDDARLLAKAASDIGSGAAQRLVEVRCIRGDGLPLRASLRFYPLQGEGGPPICAVACTDATEIRSGEGWLETRFRTLFAQAPLGICVTSLTGVLLEVNPAYAAMVGYTVEELRGRVSTELMLPEELPFIVEQLMQTDRVPSATFQHRVICKDGRIIWCEATVALLRDAEGNLTQGITFVRDITREKLALQDAERARERLQQTQKLESLGLLSGGIAHDFNNLLCVIQGQTELARMILGRSHPVAENLTGVQDAAQQATELCRQLLAYSGRGRFSVKPLHLSQVVRSIQQVLSVSVSNKGRIIYQLAVDLPSVEADASQLRQVLLNLVLNAAEALMDASGSITVTTASEEYGAEALAAARLGEGLEPGRYVWLEVSDTGKGMDSSTQEHLFEPFFTTKGTGRGLGLAAVLGIVRGHRGALELRSAPGAGTTFRFLLPACDKAPASHSTSAAPELDAAEAWQGTGTALVVDDEPGVRTVLCGMLEQLGFSAVTAVDGQEALELFGGDPTRFAIVVLDMTMPRLSGPDTYRAMRRLNPAVRVVMASGYDEDDAASQFIQEEAPGFVEKPVRFASLRRRVREALTEGRGHHLS